jgi:glucose/mannose-6-phosphate isomerase
MTYEEGILNIPEQFKSILEIVNKEKLRPFKHLLVLGMGGSRLGADLLAMYRRDLDIHVHSDASLPGLSPEMLSEALIIADSYSGSTQETISAAKEALEKGYNLAIVASGGELAQLAAEHQLPHIVIPHSELPARLIVGYSMVAIATLANIDLKEFKETVVSMEELKKQAKDITAILAGGIPAVYVAETSNELGYCWKIILNETAKIPAFYNRFPEAAHNEIEGYTSMLSEQLRWLMLEDGEMKHMKISAELLKGKNIPGAEVAFTGTLARKILSSFILAHWTGLELATKINTDPLSTPIINKFKEQLRS